MGGYDPLLAPPSGYGECIEPLQASFARANESVTQASDIPHSLMQRIDPMRDFRDAKAMAQTLREALKTKSVSLTHSEPPPVVRPYDHVSIGQRRSDDDCLIIRLLPRQDAIGSCLCSARGELVKDNVHHVVAGLNIPHNVLLSGEATLPYCVPSARFIGDL